MISSKNLEDRVNELIDQGSLTELQILQLSGIPNFLSNAKSVVSQISDLPDATLNTGNLIYVVAEEDFYLSDGEEWTIDFDTSFSIKSSITYAWGRNGNGRLGDGTTTDRSSPVTVIGGITNWAQVSAGESHSIGLTDAGVLYAWGSNVIGQLGDGTTTARSSPVTVVGGITNWSNIEAGHYHNFGLINNGVLYAWGYNGEGQLGDGTTTQRTSPVTVVGGITNWAQASGDVDHSLGVTASGIAYAWGRNNYGKLGDGTTTARSSPVTVIGGITNWAQVSAGRVHSLGVAASGIAYAWGRNSTGQLGDGTTTNRSSPVTVIGGITNWSQVSAGRDYSLGVTASGIAYAWGYNIGTGQLGDGTTSARSSPVTVIGGITNWAQVSAGGYHSQGVTSSGIAYAWGRNNLGQLGDGTTTNRSSPVTMLGGITNWVQVSTGFNHSMAISQNIKGF